MLVWFGWLIKLGKVTTLGLSPACTVFSAMSRGCKSEPRCFGGDIRRLLLAAEAGHKADVLTYYSGHLGPSGLNQNQRHQDTKQVIWKLSQSPGENPNPAKPASRQTKAQTCVRERELEEAPAELTAGTASLETDYSSHASRRADLTLLPKIIHSSSNSLYGKKLLGGPAKSTSPPIPKQQNLLGSDGSHHGGLNNDQLETKQRCGSSFTARQDPWAGKSAAEKHERKLQMALKKLSAQSWPHRDRLAVFSDVFDDVCESSPVFGRILREIKTDYDLYVNYMMDSSSAPHNTLSKPPFEDLGNGRLRDMELEDAKTEVCRLEQEARGALEENKRIRNELQNVPAIIGPGDGDMKKTSLSELQDNGTMTSDSIQTKRLQVLNMWREIQQLEEEIKEKLVCDVTTAATERSIKGLQTEIVRLIASNDRVNKANKDLENKINVILDREKLSKTQRRLLWDEIHSD